jgi:hypothetical protein
LVVGTSDAIRIVAAGTEQVRTLFNLGPELEPLSSEEIIQLLTRRYRALRANPKRPVRAPVENQAVTAVYSIFHGDLRGTLAALDSATHELLGYAGNSPRAPLTFQDLRSVLPGIYAERVRLLLSPDCAESLRTIVVAMRKHRTDSFTRREVRDWLGIGHAKMSRLVGELVRNGFAIESGKERTEGAKRPTSRYALTGVTHLAFRNF